MPPRHHTPEVAAELTARDKRVEYRRHAVNQGHIATYHDEGLNWARGDYTLTISADDPTHSPPGEPCRQADGCPSGGRLRVRSCYSIQ